MNDINLIMHALSFAAHKHRDQRRKDVDASPYINHPISLADILTNEGGISDVDVICAALLHDTIEDTDTTTEELEAAFGTVITLIVVEVSDDTSLPRLERKRLQIEHAAHASDKAKLVKLADKIPICATWLLIRLKAGRWNDVRNILTGRSRSLISCEAYTQSLKPALMRPMRAGQSE